MKKENPYIVRKVSIVDTIRNIGKGETVQFESREAGAMSSARVAIYRLNAKAGKELYKISTADNGVTYTIAHIE